MESSSASALDFEDGTSHQGGEAEVDGVKFSIGS